MDVDQKLATQAMIQALRQLFDENLLHPDVANGIQYIPPEDTPQCSRGSSCRGSGRVDIVEFIRYDNPMEAVCDYVANYMCAGHRCNAKCLRYLRTGLCATCQCKPRKSIISLEGPLVDSLGRACQISARPCNGFVIPQTAYRSLIDYLQCDPSFCNHAIPTFLPLGWVSLAFHQSQREQSIRMAADCMCQIVEPDVVAIPVQTGQPEPCDKGLMCEVEPNTQEGDDCQLDLSTARFNGGQFGWDDDYKLLGARERRRLRQQAKRSIRNMRTRK